MQGLARVWLALIFALVALPVTVAAQEVPEVHSAGTDEPVKAESAPAPDTSPDTSDTKPAFIPTKQFAARSAFWDSSLSPDGEVISLLRRVGGDVKLLIINPDTGKAFNAIDFADGTEVEWTRWVSDDKMLIQISGIAGRGGYFFRYKRLILAYPKEGRFDFLIEDPRNLHGGNVIHVFDGGEYALIAHRGDGRLYTPSVFKYELKVGGTVEKVQDPKNYIWSWTADKEGVVRLGMGWKSGKINIWYRAEDGGKLERISKFKPGDKEGFFEAIQIIGGSSTGYVLDEDESGRVGLRVFDYEKQEIAETVYEHPEWDVEDVWLKDGEPLAAFYTDDRQQIVWFDEEYEKTYDELKAAVGGQDVWIRSRSEDGKKMLVWSGSEADPGVLYMYDREAKKLSEVAQYRPGLDFDLLVKPKAVSYTARDGTDIRAYLTLPRGRGEKDLPLIILPHGGPFGIRDSLTYNDEVQFLANRGYAVLQPNFRGSGGYGDAFYELGNGQVGRGMQDDLDDAMDWAVEQGFADKSRVCVVGGSYGGYAALWAVLRNPERYRCAASWAGVTDWDKMLRYDRRYLTNRAGKRWIAKIEGDDDDFDLKDVSPYRLAESLSRPVLLAHGTEDTNVPIKQFELMKKSAKDAEVPMELLLIEGEGHSFSKAKSEQAWYDALEVFLAKHNPAD